MSEAPKSAAYEEAVAKGIAYPHLYSGTEKDGPACDISEADAAWLEEQIDAGKLRVTTQADIDAWLVKAKEIGTPTDELTLECNRIFTVLDKIHFPQELPNGQKFNCYLVFFVSPDAIYPFPTGYCAFHDIKRGGLHSGYDFWLGPEGKKSLDLYPYINKSLYGY